MKQCLFSALAEALACTEIDEKLQLTAAIAENWRKGNLDLDRATSLELSCGRPEKPTLVLPKDVPQRNPASPEGRAGLLHAIVHIEFSAINLALDHAARFRGMPEEFYADWIGVAEEEAQHFFILRQRLRAMGYDYGDFPAHAGLWEMAKKTAHDVLVRMALVPRLLEARGLDVTPPIQRKLEACGDYESARVLDTILRDEIGHVGLGDKWFRRLCTDRQLDAEETFRMLLKEYQAPWPQGKLNESARLAAGFTPEELRAFLEPALAQ